MEFKKYQHLERFGTTEVNGIENGMCYIFPKIDGTNSSLWFNDFKIQAGSRNRHLSLDNDNAGFLSWAITQNNFIEFFKCNPEYRLFGEWLVPHTLKTYEESAWRRFYVFDVLDNYGNYLNYEKYSQILDFFAIEYITPICKIKNPSYERLINQLEKNTFLIKDGLGVGEGIVIKNYEYKNKFGNIIWAKIVKNEFKLQNQKVMGIAEIKEKKIIEEEIVNKYVTYSLIEKEFSKIEIENGWSSKLIPRLISTVYYSLIKEECWNFIKEFKDPVIDFNRLKQITISKIKECKKELF